MATEGTQQRKSAQIYSDSYPATDDFILSIMALER